MTGTSGKGGGKGGGKGRPAGPKPSAPEARQTGPAGPPVPPSSTPVAAGSTRPAGDRRRALYRLPDGAEPVLAVRGGSWDGNSGLLYDKFCDQWTPDFSGFPEGDARDVAGGKLSWVLSVVRPRLPGTGRPDPAKPRVKCGDKDLLDEFAKRRIDLLGRHDQKPLRYVLDSRFVTGLGRRHPVENGFAWHHLLGTPYLPGAGVKGLVRAWAEHYETETSDRIRRIFGPPPASGALSVGSVIFLDALPVAPVQLVAEVMTPHYGPWYQAEGAAVPADWHSPTPIPFLAVECGTEFSFGILPRRPADIEDCGQVEVWLAEALAWLGAGAKTAVGYGRFGPAPERTAGDALKGAAAAPARIAGKPSDSTPKPAKKAYVGGEPVTVLRQEGSRMVVRFLDSDYEEDVDPRDIEYH